MVDGGGGACGSDGCELGNTEEVKGLRGGGDGFGQDWLLQRRHSLQPSLASLRVETSLRSISVSSAAVVEDPGLAWPFCGPI